MTATLAPTEAANTPDTRTASDLLIEASGVGKKFCRNFRLSLRYGMRDIVDSMLLRRTDGAILRPEEFWAVDNVSFNLQRGDSLGLLGDNGSGKSTLLKLITGQRMLTTGRVVTRGRIVALNDLGLGFDSTLTGRENIFVNGAVFGFPRERMAPLVNDIIAFAELEEFIDAAVQTYSTGMRARLGFAVATHLEPDILIVDEVLSVGDFAFRRKCMQHVAHYLKRGGSLVLVAHDSYLIQSICNRVIVMEHGRSVFDGPVHEGAQLYFDAAHTRTIKKTASQAETAAPMEAASGQRDAAGIADSPPAADAPPATASRPQVALSDRSPVAIDRIDLRNAKGGPLATDEPAIVDLHYRSLIDFSGTWGFQLVTADQSTVIAACNRDPTIGVFQLHAGAHVLRCRIPRFLLCPGAFCIRAAIVQMPSLMPIATLGWQDAPEFFTVAAPEASFNTNLQSMLNTLIKLDVEW